MLYLFRYPVNRPVSARYTSLWNSRVKISLECSSKLARLSKKFHPYDLVVVRVIRSSSNRCRLHSQGDEGRGSQPHQVSGQGDPSMRLRHDRAFVNLIKTHSTARSIGATVSRLQLRIAALSA